jgi:hypothetical protein
MKKLVFWADENDTDLTTEERNLLSVAYKNVIGFRRASWRSLNEPLSQEDNNYQGLVGKFKSQVEQELDQICAEVIDLLENYLVKNAARLPMPPASHDAHVFYLKMLGDYWRYRAESVSDATGYNQKAEESYAAAMKLAEKHLEATHPIRLGLALNYSVCFFEILDEPKKACDLAKSAFDLAISKLDRLKEEDYENSTLIMQLLRDNLTLWTSDTGMDRDQPADMEDVEN